MNDQLNATHIAPVTGLTYRVRPGAAGQGKSPCLVLLHGVGANEAGFIDLARQLDPRVTVVLARGPVALSQSQFAWFQVNFTANGPAINPVQAEQARIQLIDFIGQLRSLLDVDPKRIWIAGFSQGGIMSASIALTSPASVGAFGILSGRILTEIDPLIPDNVATYPIEGLVMHGRIDPALPFSHAEASVRRLESLGVVHTLLAYDNVDHGLSNTMRNDFRDWVDKQIARAG